jgi:hypothetical protein
VTVADPRYVPYHWCEDVTPELLVAQRDELAVGVRARSVDAALDVRQRALGDADPGRQVFLADAEQVTDDADGCAVQVACGHA